MCWLVHRYISMGSSNNQFPILLSVYHVLLNMRATVCNCSIVFPWVGLMGSDFPGYPVSYLGTRIYFKDLENYVQYFRLLLYSERIHVR